jgi:serine-type D-Ala-D-Ala carboxypeptidase
MPASEASHFSFHDPSLQCRAVTALDDFLRREIDAGSFPGAVYAIGSSRGIERENALGLAVAVPLRIPATLDTLFDCASLTKPLITTTLALQLLNVDDRLRQLLTHTSGLRAWMPLYLRSRGSEVAGSRGGDSLGDRETAKPRDRATALRARETAKPRDRATAPRDRATAPRDRETAQPRDSDTAQSYLAAIREQGAEYEPGTRVVYSDLNFVLLWSMLPDYISLARERILGSLGVEGDAMFNPPTSLLPRIAATEWGQRFEAKLAGIPEIAALRDGLIWGEVHDGNSFGAGGTVGNAGLFATARAVFRMAQAWANAELLPRNVVSEATRNQTPGMNESRGLGWQISPTGMYGHTGFTGTSVWIDAVADRIMVLLTNRVHPCAAANSMQRIRAEFHRLA